MTATRIRRAILPLGLAGVAVAAMMSGGTAATAKPGADTTAKEAQIALAKGKITKAISLAEAVVAASPREPAYRTLLGNAYLRAGRFESAITTFDDAMELGDNSARTALALALANVAAGRNQDAVAILNDWRDAIPASDLGLALALAGETSRGVAVLSDAVRTSEPSVKIRQNLAYAFALDGRWREARLMVAQDIPADKVDARISDWAMQARPEDYHQRIATLLAVPVRSDPGQPQALALNASPATQQLAVEAAAPVVAADQLPVEVAAAMPQPAPVEAPAAEPAKFERAFAAAPVVQPIPSSPVATAAAEPVRAAPVRVTYNAPAAKPAKPRAVRAQGSHLVQLGSFSSPQGARRAWGIFSKRNPALRSYRMAITPAVVHGKNFWRVAAAGFDARSASGMCSSVKARGGVCFAYSALPARATAPGKPSLARNISATKLARR